MSHIQHPSLGERARELLDAYQAGPTPGAAKSVVRRLLAVQANDVCRAVGYREFAGSDPDELARNLGGLILDIAVIAEYMGLDINEALAQETGRRLNQLAEDNGQLALSPA